MAKVPGSAGVPLIGDKSYDFYKDPIKFQQKHMENTRSRVFRSRFLNKPTIFVGSNKVLNEVLKEKADCMKFGYKNFMFEIYGDNIIFRDGDSAALLREALGQLFTSESVNNYQDTIDRIVDGSISNMKTSDPVCIYKCFKQLSTELCLSLFLGLDFTQTEAAVIAELTTTHWHGIISVPLSVRVPGMAESTYSKAMEAKKRLLAIIEERRAQKCHHFLHKVEALQDFDDSNVNHHLLLLTSALVPKALASVLTSIMVQLGTSEYADLQRKVLQDEDLLTRVLHEIIRLYPPFIGGYRTISKTFTAGEFLFPEGETLLYLTYMANRDPDVFDSPDTFQPDRWKHMDPEETLFSFGAGPRKCIGQKLIWSIFNTVIKKMLGRYHVTLEDGQDLSHKWLPVSRPKSSVRVKLQAHAESDKAHCLN